ncbi:MAG TPA: hypothetical protein VLO31_02705 [Cryobacterium sp.]|nr:hypothetical protein [Cryobacterium sp.]
MKQDFEGPRLDRRSVLRLGAAIGVFAAAALTGAVPARASALGLPAALDDTTEIPLELEPLYSFRCFSLQGPVAEYSRLAEVWASTQYMRITSCEVNYIGPGAHSLTLEESAIVQVAEDAGMAVDDRAAAYLSILTTCTRIPLDTLEVRLAELGAPVVTAALALAPEAPQAKQLAEWLARAA